MIVYDLACVCGYTFEGWFQNRNDFDSQQRAAFLVCPACSGRQIRKILSPVSVKTGSEARSADQGPPRAATGDRPATEAETLQALQDFVEKNFEDVGASLAAEALKIHYGVERPRNIRGVATEAEEKTLADEGISLLKVPLPARGGKVN